MRGAPPVAVLLLLFLRRQNKRNDRNILASNDFPMILESYPAKETYWELNDEFFWC